VIGIYISLGLYGITLYLLPVEVVNAIFLVLGALIFLGLFVAAGWFAQWRIEEWWIDRDGH